MEKERRYMEINRLFFKEERKMTEKHLKTS